MVSCCKLNDEAATPTSGRKPDAATDGRGGEGVKQERTSIELPDDARIGVIGGGPAGSMFAYFVLLMAERVGFSVNVDVYESRDFTCAGPAGCNMCGGIVSESLVQLLATEGVNLPPGVVRRGIESYVLHTDGGQARIASLTDEMRIAALYRGGGPKGSPAGHWISFDEYLLGLASEKGANVIRARVKDLSRDGERPVIHAQGVEPVTYDVIAGAFGVNSRTLELFAKIGVSLPRPSTCRTFIGELKLGEKRVRETLGDAMHAFLVNVPRLEFGALIPKGDYVTMCLLGRDVDKELVERFMAHPEVQACLPGVTGMSELVCRCSPVINVGAGKRIFADRVVLLGDCGVSRLYKDGIGAAYRAAKACAVTVLFRGVSEHDFATAYWPHCRRMHYDNLLGKLMFAAASVAKRFGFLSRAIVETVKGEQKSLTTRPSRRVLSTVLWDLLTGSAPYRDVVIRSIDIRFLLRFSGICLRELVRRPGPRKAAERPGQDNRLSG